MQLLTQPLSIVGNAESIFQKEYGKLIDARATIRFNRADIIRTESQGSRWDFLASSEINTFEKYNTETPKFHTLIFTPTKKELEYKIKKVNFKADKIRLPLDQSQWLEKELDVPPSTGLQILYYLDQINNKNVSIFGFDFKETKTFYEIRNKGKHDYDKERSFVLKLIKQNGWKIYR